MEYNLTNDSSSREEQRTPDTNPFQISATVRLSPPKNNDGTYLFEMVYFSHPLHIVITIQLADADAFVILFLIFLMALT